MSLHKQQERTEIVRQLLDTMQVVSAEHMALAQKLLRTQVLLMDHIARDIEQDGDSKVMINEDKASMLKSAVEMLKSTAADVIGTHIDIATTRDEALQFINKSGAF